MSETTIRVPAAVAGDPTDVSTALEVARALWQKGSRDDAIHWVKRAIDAASEAGLSARATALMTAAIELERANEGLVEAAPEPEEVAAEEESVEPIAAQVAGASVSTAPKPPPAPSAAASRPPPAPSASPRAATDPPPLPGAVSRAPSPSAKPAASVSPRPTGHPAPAARGRASAAPQISVAARPAPARLPSGERIRVSVKSSVRDPGLLVVRPLAEGRPLPPGTREGFLVLEEEAVDDARRHANGSAPS